MMTFVGSPTIVENPPTFAARISAMTNGTGSIPSPSKTSIVNGTMNRATVTMSRSEAIPAVMRGSRMYIRNGCRTGEMESHPFEEACFTEGRGDYEHSK